MSGENLSSIMARLYSGVSGVAVERIDARADLKRALDIADLDAELRKAEEKRDAAIEQLREVQKLAIGYQHRYKNAETALAKSDKAFAALKESSAKCDAERIDLRSEVVYLLDEIKRRSGNEKED